MTVPNKISFCSIAELKGGRRVTKWVDEWRDEITAFMIDGEIKVLSSICPHFGGEFDLVPDKRILRCKWHGLEFDLDSGKCTTFQIAGCLRRYPFEEREGRLEVRLP